MKIAVTTDHAGYEALRELRLFLSELGHECIDFGPREFNAADDYPDFMFPAAQAVSRGECDCGIILGGSGQGEAMAANRFRNVRCSLFYGQVIPKNAVEAESRRSNDPYEVLKLTRQHNHSNMLSLSSWFLSLDEMKTAIQVWLTTPYSETERHVRRVTKLSQQGSD